MTRHGKFEAVALLHRSAHTSLWSARPAGAATASPNHCFKLVELSDHELADRDASAAEHLLVGAALQQSMADKSEGWAPIYELGSDGTDAFYVTKLYPRSAQSMIDGRARLGSGELRTILLAVVDALLDLQTAYGRPHANLKPSNVLLGDQIRPGQVQLTDPGAIAENVPSLTRAPDPKAVGQLLYALVTHRPHTGARWPLAHGDAWRALGASGRQWFSLCEALVNPFSDSLPDLQELRLRILSIRSTRRRLPRLAAAVPVLAAIALAAYLGRAHVRQWYHTADHQLAMLTQRGKPEHKGGRALLPLPALNPRVNPKSYTPAIATERPAPAVTPAVAVHARPAVVPPPVAAPTPAPPDLSATLAGLTAGPTADPPPVRPVVDAPPVAPVKPAPAATEPTGGGTANHRALALVREWSPPDFKSDAAQAAFEEGRRQFVQAHDADDASATLGQWEAISARLRLAGEAFPPVDVAATAGWPVSVANQVAARREQVLARAVGAAFDQKSFDPTSYHKLTAGVRQAVSAATFARKAMTGGSVPAARSAVADYQAAVRQVAATDEGVAEVMSAASADLNRLSAVETATDRDKLLATADDESAPLAVRVDAWLRAATVPGDKPWPGDFAAAAADHARGVGLASLLHDQLASTAEQEVTTEADRRLAAFLGGLHDQPATAAAAAQAGDPQYADLLERCPAWFRFDAALAVARRTPAASVRPDQQRHLLDLAAAAQVPAGRDVIDLLRAGDHRGAGALADAGPAATGRWRLHAGSGRDRCTYDATTGTRLTLEFLRVHVPAADVAADSAGLDCYLCTTAVPVSLASHLLANDPTAIAGARDLTPATIDAGARVWKFSDDPANPVTVDADGYRKCFVVSPTDQLPVQRVTPQLALFLARRAGCRLPSAAEWRAAMEAARASSDPIVHGFATQGWKLRTASNYTALLASPARDPSAQPGAGVFQAHGDGVWTTAALAALGGRAAGDPPSRPDGWPLSTLETTDGFGFRAVTGTDAYGGVFHDLVGNVAQFAVDLPATLAEQLDPSRPTAAADVRAWFTPDRLAAVSVVGGSALSPPTVDPTKPCPLPAGPAAFADVGFRLAFTDPAARGAEAWSALRRAAFATAP